MPSCFCSQAFRYIDWDPDRRLLKCWKMDFDYCIENHLSLMLRNHDNQFKVRDNIKITAVDEWARFGQNPYVSRFKWSPDPLLCLCFGAGWNFSCGLHVDFSNRLKWMQSFFFQRCSQILLKQKLITP